MLHVSERSTSTMSWPTARSVSRLEPRCSDLSIGHLPASIDSKKRVPPRSARLMLVRSSTVSDERRARCRCSRMEPPSEPPPGLILRRRMVMFAPMVAPRMAPTTPHACLCTGWSPPASKRSIESTLSWPLSCWTGSVAKAVSAVLLGCSRMRSLSVVFVASASASTSMCSGMTDASVRHVSVELARMRPAKSVNERRERIWSLSLRST